MEHESRRQERRPGKLLNELNALKPSEVMQFVKKDCSPDSGIFQQYHEEVLKIIAKDANVELTLDEIEYVTCFALMTDDIKALPICALTQATKHLQSTKPTSHLIESLNWIDTVLRSKYESTLLRHHLKYINQSVPCYMNYSGLNLTHLENIENINFSNSTCRNFTGKDLIVKNCDFSNINWSGSTILNISGEGCTFGKSICENMTFITAEDVETRQMACITFDRLHGFLSKSKGRDTLKAAILKDIIGKIKELQNADTQNEVARVLYEHPLTAEHRSFFMSKTSRKTNSQNTITKEFGITDEVAHRESIMASSYEEFDLVRNESGIGESGPSPMKFFQELLDSMNEEDKLSNFFGSMNFKWFGNRGEVDSEFGTYDEKSSLDSSDEGKKNSSTCIQQ